MLEKYYSDSTGNAKKQPLFTIEIVYTVPTSEQRENNNSLQLLYRTKVIHRINKKTNKIVTIETEELAEARYNCDFLNSVVGIDQNLDQFAIGGIAQEKTLAFNYDIKYLKSINQHWSVAKQKAKLQTEISFQKQLLQELKYAKLDFYKTFLTEYSVSKLIESTEIVLKKITK